MFVFEQKKQMKLELLLYFNQTLATSKTWKTSSLE